MASYYFDTSTFSNADHTLSPINYTGQIGKYSVTLKTGGYYTFNHIRTNFLHSHDFYEICVVLKGKGTFTHGTRQYKLSEGMLFLADKQIIHEIASDENDRLHIVYFSFDFIETPNAKSNIEDGLITNFINKHSLIIDNIGDLLHYLPLLNRSSTQNQSLAIINVDLLRTLIFEFLLKLTNTGEVVYDDHKLSDEKDHPIRIVETYISNHINQQITVNMLSDHCHISERNLRRLVKKYYRTTITDLIRQKKMNRAQNMLNMGFSTSMVSDSCGYSDTDYFIKVFKLFYGLTPKQYRDRHLSFEPNKPRLN